MVDKDQVQRWLKEGTISPVQAKKMLSDFSDDSSKGGDGSSGSFFSIIAIIGAVLVFIGFAWLLASNWHYFSRPLKLIILVTLTLLSFVGGFSLREKKYEGAGRSFIALGALLFILSIFLIAQMYFVPSGLQGYATLLLICWAFIALTAYFMDSKENLFIALVTFFFWAVIQYLASFSSNLFGSMLYGGVSPFFGIILLFLGAGALLYGLSVLHASIDHKFKEMYRFWTAFYFFSIFYILSFQSFLIFAGAHVLEAGVMSLFLVLFLSVCFLGLLIGIIFAMKNNTSSFKEIILFVGLIVLIFVMIISTKIGAGTMGMCSMKGCYSFSTQESCNLAPSSLNCMWQDNNRYCQENYSRLRVAEVDYQTCSKYNNQEDNCVENPICQWTQNYYAYDNLPTSLWLLWIVNNILFIGFIILMLGYGQKSGSSKIVNLSLMFFILDIIARYIGFWMDLSGYFSFSMLAIFGGVLLILGAWLIPKWRRKLLENIYRVD